MIYHVISIGCTFCIGFLLGYLLPEKQEAANVKEAKRIINSKNKNNDYSKKEG